MDTAKAFSLSTDTHVDELLLNDTTAFPSRGYLEVQGSDLSRDPQSVVGYAAKRDADNVLIIPKWLRDNGDLNVSNQGAYGTSPLTVSDMTLPPNAYKVVTRIPVRYWDRFVGFKPETPGTETYEWVRQAPPALVFRARKRLPGSYLEEFSWRYYDPATPSPTPGLELPSDLRDYVNVYVELLLDGRRVYHEERSRQLGYFEEPVDAYSEPWAVNRKFDEIEIRVYFDYTAHPNSTSSDPDDAYTSGISDVAPKIDKFLLYLRQPVSTALVVPGPG